MRPNAVGRFKTVFVNVHGDSTEMLAVVVELWTRRND